MITFHLKILIDLIKKKRKRKTQTDKLSFSMIKTDVKSHSTKEWKGLILDRNFYFNGKLNICSLPLKFHLKTKNILVSYSNSTKMLNV